MDEDCDASEDFDCPSLICEEQEDLKPRNDQPVDRNKEEEDEVELLFNQINCRKQTGDHEQAGNNENNEEEPDQAEPEAVAGVEVEAGSPGGADKDITNNESAKTEHKEACDDKDEQKRGRKRRSKKQNERSRCKKSCKVVDDKGMTENPAQELEKSPADPSLEPTDGLMDSSELADPMSGMWSIGMYRPPVPMALYSSQPPLPIQPTPLAPQGTKRPHSPYLHSVPQTNPQPLEMEITQVYSTRRSIRYSTRDRGRSLSYPVMPGLENIDTCLLPPAPKKKTRTLYSTDQLEHLESLFQEDHYPDAEKRKAIAASVGVTPQRIMVWFQNRRAKWRKVERSISAKAEQKASRTGPHSSPPHAQVTPALPSLPLNKPPSFSGHFTTKQSQIAPTALTLPPLYSNLSSSPGHSRVRDGEPHQLSSQGGLGEYHPRPMHSPPPIRRASLPLFTTAYNPGNPNPPLLNSLAHTSPLFLDALEAGASLPHHDMQPLQADTSSLFDFGEKMDYLSSAQQNTLLYQLQTSYPSSQPQPCVPYLNPSPYLTPNPPDSTSYLTFGPGAGSTGVVTYSTGGHAFFQSQSTGQVLLQSTGPHGGITAYQSCPWGNMYSQASLHQRPQCPPSYSSTLSAPRDLQLAPSGSAPPSVFFTRDQRSSHTQTHLNSSTLPPVSTLRPLRLRAETTPTKAAPLLPVQVSPASPQSPPVPSCVKIEYDSPREIHSHFHCDFSPIHF
ncbi:histone-lysine N-methyltransferase 2B-like [Boleophthalmus pectinirostris]|uniref:histone-lysine N-methyltransferase 2B-like n=1 Tax=Boleophthalmus pectinirostris TaxID=150288 RepID=UPI00242D43BF|nr:histone-lysine N-methyltransferase 2B-like [Boleophthalmus pectinirostris]